MAWQGLLSLQTGLPFAAHCTRLPNLAGCSNSLEDLILAEWQSVGDHECDWLMHDRSADIPLMHQVDDVWASSCAPAQAIAYSRQHTSPQLCLNARAWSVEQSQDQSAGLHKYKSGSDAQTQS